MKKILVTYASLFCKKLNVLYTILASFLFPIKVLLILVGMMIIIDTIMGIWRSFKLKVDITSKALSAVVSKMVLYQSAVILIFILEKYLLTYFFESLFGIELFLTKIVATTLCGIELMSINESYNIVAGFSIWDKFRLMLKRSKSFKEEIKEIID